MDERKQRSLARLCDAGVALAGDLTSDGDVFGAAIVHGLLSALEALTLEAHGREPVPEAPPPEPVGGEEKPKSKRGRPPKKKAEAVPEPAAEPAPTAEMSAAEVVDQPNVWGGP